MSINNEKDLIGIQNASQVAKHLRDFLVEQCLEGVSTGYLDLLCKKEMKAIGAKSAPRVFYHAPSYAFYSLNHQVVHGLPTHAPLKFGDVLKIDVTPIYEGYIADTACTVQVGEHHQNSLGQRLIQAVIDSFNMALRQCTHGVKVNQIGKAIEESTKDHGFKVIRELSGHGVGRAIHEEPSVLNYYHPGQQARLTSGLVIAIEPMIVNKPSPLHESSDGWTIKTKPGTITAHYEHTVLITEHDPIVLTA